MRGRWKCETWKCEKRDSMEHRVLHMSVNLYWRNNSAHKHNYFETLFHTLAFHTNFSRIFHPCNLVPHFHVSHFQSPHTYMQTDRRTDSANDEHAWRSRTRTRYGSRVHRIRRDSIQGLKKLGYFEARACIRLQRNLDFSNNNVRLVIRTPFQKLRYYFCCINVLRLSNFYF